MISFSSFIDEVESIQKEAGWMTNKALPWVKTQGKGIGGNLAATAKGFASPAQGLREGTRFTLAGLKGGQGLMGALNLAGLGLTALQAPMYLSKEDRLHSGDSRFVRGARFVGSQVGGLIGAPHGISGGIAGGLAGEAIGRYAAKGAERLVGAGKKLKKKPKQTEQATLPLATYRANPVGPLMRPSTEG